MYNMTISDDGFVQMGNDGVVRSWNEDGKVIDYVRLNNRQLVHSVHYFGGHSKRDKDVVLDMLRSVSGHDVPSDGVFNPPQHIMPPEFRDSPSPPMPGTPPASEIGEDLEKRVTTTTLSILTITHPIPSAWPECIGQGCAVRRYCILYHGWDCWACLQVHGPNFPKTCVHMDYPYGIGPSPYFGPIVVTGGRSGGKRDSDGGEEEEEGQA